MNGGTKNLQRIITKNILIEAFNNDSYYLYSFHIRRFKYSNRRILPGIIRSKNYLLN